ncbi:hypothetical protein BDQ17DRAFT_1109777 [Cyathus striatus]|nr:hypothetical protein BDQ17DRAFT_1109777 [Cyathus striatus]
MSWRPPLWDLRVHYGRGKGKKMSDDEERLVREEVGDAVDRLFRSNTHHPSISSHTTTTTPIQALEDICVRMVINVVQGLIKDERVDAGIRMKGCYVFM